jgi:hypothetical protein
MKIEFLPYTLSTDMVEIGYDAKHIDYFYKREDGGYELFRDSCDPDVTDDVPFVYPFDKIPAILCQQAFRWFREKHGYYADLFVDDDKTFGFCITYFTYTARVDKPIQRRFISYEEAEIACIKQLIEIVVKNK